MVIGSLHSNPLFHFLTRKKETQYIKKCVLEYNRDTPPVIFGGDFNSGLSGEKIRNDHIFAPEFANITWNSGPTVDSRYVEPVVFVNKLAVFLAKLGIRIRLKVDHVYADTKTAKSRMQCRVLDARASDHSPVEVILGN